MILSGERLVAPPQPCAGLLIIGDPHLSSRRPGRRSDADWPAAILRKLEHCVALANARDLAPVLLGDLFERPVEPDESLKARLVRILKGFRHRPLANVGNHDTAQTRLGDGDSLALLALSDVLDTCPVSAPVARYRLEDRIVGVGLSPYGCEIPEHVAGAVAGAEATVWFTHHDLAFGNAYPGALPLPAITGCALAVNGHVHTPQAPRMAGETRWFNPGNITRRTLDLADHVPTVWVLDGNLALTGERLPHLDAVFDRTGLQVEAGPAQFGAPVESAFVSLLTAEAATELRQSDDGTLLGEALEAKFARDGTPEPVRSALRALLAQAVDRRARAR